MTPTAFEDGEAFDLGEAECPACGYPVVGYFQNGQLVRTGSCMACMEAKDADVLADADRVVAEVHTIVRPKTCPHGIAEDGPFFCFLCHPERDDPPAATP